MTDKLRKLVEDGELKMADHDSNSAKSLEVAESRGARINLDAAAKIPGKDKIDRSAATKIQARIDGQDVVFQLTTDDLQGFEQVNGSAYEALLKITNGSWTVELLKRVLTYAVMPDKDRAVIARMGRVGIGSSHKVPTGACLLPSSQQRLLMLQAFFV